MFYAITITIGRAGCWVTMLNLIKHQWRPPPCTVLIGHPGLVEPSSWPLLAAQKKATVQTMQNSLIIINTRLQLQNLQVYQSTKAYKAAKLVITNCKKTNCSYMEMGGA